MNNWLKRSADFWTLTNSNFSASRDAGSRKVVPAPSYFPMTPSALTGLVSLTVQLPWSNACVPKITNMQQKLRNFEIRFFIRFIFMALLLVFSLNLIHMIRSLILSCVNCSLNNVNGISLCIIGKLLQKKPAIILLNNSGLSQTNQTKLIQTICSRSKNPISMPEPCREK